MFCDRTDEEIWLLALSGAANNPGCVTACPVSHQLGTCVDYWLFAANTTQGMICSTSPAKPKTASFATRIKKVIKENTVSPEVILLTPSWSKNLKYSLHWSCQEQVTFKNTSVLIYIFTTCNSLQCPKNSMKILTRNYRISHPLDIGNIHA